MAFTSCEKGHLHGIGDIVTEIRQTEDYNSIEINDNIDIHIFCNHPDAGKIEITGGEYLIPHISTEVKNSTLIIKNNNKWNWIRSFKKSKVTMNIYLDTLVHIIYNGVGELVTDNSIDCKHFTLESRDGMGKIDLNLNCDSASIIVHTGAPDVFLSGKANYAHIYANGHGQINALNFNVDDLAVHARSTSNVFVSALYTLGVTIDYSGNVYYQNNPLILWVAENSTGQLIKLD